MLRVSGVDDVPLRESRVRRGGLLFVSGTEGRSAGSMLREAASNDIDDLTAFMKNSGMPLSARQIAALKSLTSEDAGGDTALDGILEPDEDDDGDDDGEEDDDDEPVADMDDNTISASRKRESVRIGGRAPMRISGRRSVLA